MPVAQRSLANLRRGGAKPGPWPGAGRPSKTVVDKFLDHAVKAPDVLADIMEGNLYDTDEEGNKVKVQCSAADRTRAAAVIVQQADAASTIPAELAHRVMKVIRNLDRIVGRDLGLTTDELMSVAIALDHEFAGYRIE